MGRKRRSNTFKVGEIFPCASGKLEIVEYETYRRITVKFLKTGNITVTRGDYIKGGTLRDLEAPTVFGVGYRDGIPSKVNGITTDLYNAWVGVLERCYSPSLHERYPSYKECSVCDEWLHLSNFKKWFEENHREGYEIDKDIKKKGNKVYSPETCLYIPKSLNNLIKTNKNTRGATSSIGVRYIEDCTNNPYEASIAKQDGRKVLGYFSDEVSAFLVYKSSKEAYIKELAEEYFKAGLICKDTYNALLSYTVEKED